MLPFVNIGRDSTDDYLADGLTNDIINVLGRVPGIRVTSRNVAASAREKFTTAEDVGKALNVGRILEGTVQRDGNRLRVTARVTNTDDGFMVWSDMFERTLKDVFAVQDEISGAIATALGAQMAPAELAKSGGTEQGTSDDVAYDLYLRGRHFFQQRGEAPLRKALDLFRQATRKDPSFARAYAGIAGVYSVLPLYSSTSGDAAFAPGIEAATTAIRLDSTIADAYASRAALLAFRWRWTEAEADLQKAIALDPKHASAHQWYGEQLLVRNRVAEAVVHLRRAAELEPVSPIVGSSYAMALAMSGRDSQAVAQARRAIEMDSTLFLPRMVLGFTHILAKRMADAIRELEPAQALSRGLPFTLALLGYAYAMNGQRANADALASELATRRDPDAQAAVAMIQIGLADTARALSSMESALKRHAPFFTAQPLGVSIYDPVRSSERFQKLLRSLGVQ